MDRQPGLAKMKIEIVKSCVTTSQFTRLQLLTAYCKTTTIRNGDFILQFTCTGSRQPIFVSKPVPRLVFFFIKIKW